VVVFNRASAFAGTVEGVAPGTTLMDVSIFHIAGNHADFGPHILSVTVE
jgi:hypothetical protein